METVSLLGWVALGSALGGMARFLVSGLVARSVGETFPWGTLAVNVTGSGLIGLLSVILSDGFQDLNPHVWPLAVTGFLGSYTTVSSFSLQTLALARDGEWRRASGNVMGSLVLCITAAALGTAAGHFAMGAL